MKRFSIFATAKTHKGRGSKTLLKKFIEGRLISDTS